jgi:hypothetical protein
MTLPDSFAPEDLPDAPGVSLFKDETGREISRLDGKTSEALTVGQKAGARAVFAATHHGPHSRGPHGGHPAAAPYAALLEKSSVSVLFSGHDHLYQRSKRMNKVVYLTVGTGGAAVMRGPIDGRPWLEKEIVGHGLALARVDGKRLSLEFFDENGAALDRLDLDKP